MRIYLGSIPRCGSTYLFRSIAGLPQGGSIPPEAEAKHSIIKTHLPPDEDDRIDWQAGERAIFMFGDVAAAVVSTMHSRHEANHWANCGVDEYDPKADLLEEDVLGYADLWDAWRDPPFPVLFVRYEMLWTPIVKAAVQGWTGRTVHWLPWQRRSTVVTVGDRARARAVYGGLMDSMVGLADYFIVGREP